MAAGTPEITIRRGIEPGLIATIAASAVVHVVLFVLVVSLPGRFLRTSPRLESYTVDLVAPSAVGGTNLVPGAGRAKPPSEPVASAPKPAPAEPAAVKPQAEVAVPPPPKVAEPAKPIEAPKVVEPPKPVEPAPKPAEPPPPAVAKPPEAKPPEVKPPEVKPAAPPQPPVADARPPEAKPPAKAVEPPKPLAKVAEPAKPPPAAAKLAAPVNPPQPDVQKKAAESAAEKATKQRDDAIAAAVQRRAAQVPGGATANSDLDKQIAAAVQRRAQQVGQGTGAAAESGGPVSIGPGSGAGGTPADLQYILYQGRMEERIKAAWAWAGADKDLHAVIQFNLTAEGEIKNVRTIESSGDRQYDASCERAVRVVNPLDPVPEKYRKEFATVEMTFKPSDLER